MSEHNQTLITRINHDNDSELRTISLFIAGIGAVGGTLLQQIENLDSSVFNLNIIGVCNSKKVLWDPQTATLETDLKQSEHPTDWETITDTLTDFANGSLIFVDATGNEDVARYYLKLLTSGVHIVTPSKRANTFSQKYFNQLIKLSDSGIAEYRYETTVGAGLPVINTVQGLLDSGDKITEISGVVSGTMTYVFNQLQRGLSFSSIIKQARAEGYSEPDPRDDLSGEDVARKFLILARTCGISIEREEIHVESLVPEELNGLNPDEFLVQLAAYDEHWKRKNTKALVNNKKLRYTGSFTENGIHIGIKEVAADSPLGGLKGTDNLIQIFTKRYADSPIVIQGPGAGRDVTAAGVLADIIAIAKKIA